MEYNTWLTNLESTPSTIPTGKAINKHNADVLSKF